MIPSIWTKRRRLIPRWRSLAVTLEAQELAAPLKSGDQQQRMGAIPTDLLDKLVRWRAAPGVITAGELVEAALVAALEGEAVKAARYLISEQSTATGPLRRLAALALKRAGKTDELPAGVEVHPKVEKRVWRERTRLYPANAIAWVELSRCEVVVGRREEALRCMQVALRLAPNDRFVLRCATRLFLHLHDPERAYNTLIRGDATGRDPWLIAAEVSVAGLANKTPRYFDAGKRMVEKGDLYPRQITELAGALATVELEDGSRKKARDLFRESVRDPTGNALAQAEWAAPAFGTEIVPTRMFTTVSENDEAAAFHLLRQERLAEVPDACQRWSKVEPYSIRPFEIGSSTAGVVGDFDRALSMAREGLLVRPEAETLLNNQAFALAHLGRLGEAENSLRGVHDSDRTSWLVSRANRGLINMRQGNHAAALSYYMEAIEGFRKEQNDEMSAVARVYLAREAALAKLPEAKNLVTAARDALRRTGHKRHQNILRQAEDALGNKAEAGSLHAGGVVDVV